MKRLLLLLLLIIPLSACSFGDKWNSAMPKDEFLVIGHRGASAYVPENTLAAFKLAKDLEAPYIELDIHETKDGELVVMHDKDVKRTTDAKGKIETFTLAELKQLSIDERKKEKVAIDTDGKDLAVPTLTEVFDELGDSMNYVVELKDPERYPGIEGKLLSVLEEYDLLKEDKHGRPRVAIHSFNKKSLKHVHELNDEVPLLQLISFDEGEEAEFSKKELDDLLTYADGVGVSYEAIVPAFVNYMHEKGLAVYAYTVDDPEEALRLKAMGVNGIHSNKPDLLDRAEEKEGLSE